MPPNALCSRGGRSQRHGGRRHRVVRPVMFAEPEHVEADAVGEFDLLQEIGECLVDIDRFASARVAPGLDEGESAELHEWPRQYALLGAGGAMLA